MAQGADLKAFYTKLEAPADAVALRVEAPASGVVTHCDAQIIGEVVRDLGGGRATKDSVLNYHVGVAEMKKIGERVEQGEPLAVVYGATREEAALGAMRLREAWTVGN